jgi:HSP20 family protein
MVFLNVTFGENCKRPAFPRKGGGPAFQYHGFRIKSGVRAKIIFAVIKTEAGFYETVDSQETTMSFIKVRFAKEIGYVDAEFRRSFDEMFRLLHSTFTVFHTIWSPQVDIYESPDKIIILSDIAGVHKEDLYVEIDRRLLRIYGKREKPITENTRFHRAEITYGYFERKLALPFPIDIDSVRATYTDGLLQICIAKVPLEKIHKIPIQED